MPDTIDSRTLSPWQNKLLLALHLSVLAASVGMIVWITRETLRGVSFLSDDTYMRIQFWVCLLFLLDTLVEFCFAPRKWHYVVRNIFFILISIPWLSIVWWTHLRVTPQMGYILQFIPMIRAGYVLALISGTLSSNKGLSMSGVYMIWVLASVYFGSLVFFVEEHAVNAMVHTWWDALWWAALNITTVGCEITPVTSTGQALAIILSSEGLILFPVFTVYVTNAFLSSQKSAGPADGAVGADSTTSATAPEGDTPSQTS